MAARAAAWSSASCATLRRPTDPDTGNTLDMKVFIHKIHMGANLPSVKAGKPYQIIGFNQGVSDWSDVVFPANPGDPRLANPATSRTPAPRRQPLS